MLTTRIRMGHRIDADGVTFLRSDSKPGNALAQLEAELALIVGDRRYLLTPTELRYGEWIERYRQKHGFLPLLCDVARAFRVSNQTASTKVRFLRVAGVLKEPLPSLNDKVPAVRQEQPRQEE